MTTNNNDGKELVPRTIKITKDQKLFLEDHPEINLSGFVRRKIDEAIELEEAK